MTISFKGITKEIDKSVEAVLGFVREVGETEFATGIEERANTLTGALSNLGDATSVFKNEIGDAGFKQSMIGLIRTFTRLTNESGGFARSLGQDLGGAVKTFTGLILFLEEKFGGGGDDGEGFIDKFFFGDDPRGRMRRAAFDKLQEAFDFLKNLVDEDEKERELNIFAGLDDTELDEETLQKLDQMRAEGKGVTDFLIESMRNTKTEIDNTKNASRELSIEFTDELRQAVINTSSAFTKDFVDSLLEGENALESFKNFARNIVSQIISIFLQMAVVNEILNTVFGLTGTDRLPTLFRSSSTSSPGTGSPGMGASGKTLQRNTPYIVGERGMELFVPNTGGTLMNNMNTQNAMGGSPVVVNQSINFATGVVPTVRAEVTKMLPQISDVTKGAVLEAAVRGGQFKKGLLGG